MKALRSAIPVLRFGAGALNLAIAAEDVLTVASTTTGAEVHISTLLGVAAQPRVEEQRIVHVRSAESRLESTCFAVDAPVTVIVCHADDILPMAGGTDANRWRPILGFARLDGQILMLVDIPSIIAALKRQRTREER